MSPRKQHRTIVAAAVWVLEKLLEVNSFKIETLLNFAVHFSPGTSEGAALYKQDHYYLRVGQKHCTLIWFNFNSPPPPIHLLFLFKSSGGVLVYV